MSTVGLWKVFASLGIPGLVLGLFYMLFRHFKWKFPIVPKIWVGPIIVLFMLLTSGLTFYALLLWAPASDVTTVRIMVLGPDNMPVENSDIQSSIGGEAKRVAGGWELEFSESKLSRDRKVTIYVEQKERHLKGRQEITVADGKATIDSIQLKRNGSAQVKVNIFDEIENFAKNNTPIRQQTKGEQSPTVITEKGDVTITYGDNQ